MQQKQKLFNEIQKSPAGLVSSATVLIPSPVTVNALRQQVKRQLSSEQVAVKRVNGGDWVILRDPNFALKVKALWVKACQESGSHRERSRLFTQWLREEAERLERQTNSQVRKAKQLLLRILAPQKRPRRRHSFVTVQSRPHQPRRHGKARAPTSDGKGDDDGSDGDSTYQKVKYLQNRICIKTGLDRVYSVKSRNFTSGGVAYGAYAA